MRGLSVVRLFAGHKRPWANLLMEHTCWLSCPGRPGKGDLGFPFIYRDRIYRTGGQCGRYTTNPILLTICRATFAEHSPLNTLKFPWGSAMSSGPQNPTKLLVKGYWWPLVGLPIAKWVWISWTWSTFLLNRWIGDQQQSSMSQKLSFKNIRSSTCTFKNL